MLHQGGNERGAPDGDGAADGDVSQSDHELPPGPGTVPWRGGWEAIAEHARALGPDPALAGVDDDGLEVEVRRAAGAQAAATARLLRLVAEFVARDLWVDLGMKSPGQWLSWALGVAPSTGREMVRVALALRTFTATAEQFARGELSYSKVRAITRCGEPALERLLLTYADNAPASQLERIVQTYQQLEDDRDPQDNRCLSTRRGAHDMTLSIRVPADVGLHAMQLINRVVTQLDAERQPTDADLPTGDGADKPDDAARLDPLGARRADAFVHALQLAVNHLDQDLTGAARTTLVLEGEVGSTLDQLADPTAAGLGTEADTTGTGSDDAAGGTGSDDAPTDPGTEGAGTEGAGTGEGATGASAEAAGSATVVVRQRGGGLLRLSRRVARMLACDASLRRVSTSDGTPVDVGRTQRHATAKQHEALLLRDRGCRFPGCDATRHLHAHHVVHWVDGGPTDLDNLVLLCGMHHRFVHARKWIIEADPDGGWTFRSPGSSQSLPPMVRMLAAARGASAEAARGRDPFALQPSGWDGASLDLDAALGIMYQDLGRLPGSVRMPAPGDAARSTCPAA